MTVVDYRQPRLDSRPAPPPARRAPAPRAESAGFLTTFVQTLCILAPLACLAYAVRQFPDDPGMTDRGLVDVVSLWYYAGLAMCGLGFWMALQRDPVRQWLVAMQMTVLIVVIHAFPAFAYDAVRPFWAYKHIGVVDYITQNHGVDRSIDVYHNWPGFFALGSTLEHLTGISPLTYARWSPVLFNLLWAVGLLYVSRTLTDNVRARWLGVFLFSVTNWFVLDYFAPQALAFFWGLLIVGTMLHWLSRSSERKWVQLVADRLRPYTRTARVGPDIPQLDRPPAEGPVRIAAGAALLLIFSALTFTHQLTPFMILLMCAAIVAARRTQGQTVLVLMVIITGVWIAFAWQYLSAAGFLDINFDIRQSRGGFREIDLSRQSFSMWFFSRTGIYANIAVFVMAIVGVARRVRAGFLDTVAILLAGAPVLVLAGQSYGGEGIYRVMLFSLITVSFLAACAFYPRYSSWQASGTPATTFVLCVGLAALVPVTIYGREQMNYVYPGEVDAALYVPENAEPGWMFTTFCEGFPSRASADYNGFVDQQIDMACMLPEVLHTEPTAATVDRLADFLEESFPERGQLLFAMSRGQGAFVDVYQLLAPGDYDQLVGLMFESDRFTVFYDNDDATIFELADGNETEDTVSPGSDDPASPPTGQIATDGVLPGDVAN